jgi:hypothetical protein
MSGRCLQVERQVLKEHAAEIIKRRRSEQEALHCSPSFSLSQSFDIITPRPGTDTTLPAPLKPNKPWAQLFKGSTSLAGIPPPRPPLWPCARPPHPPLMTARSIGTPPSVEPKLHQAAERTFSTGSLRKGALSFSSHGQRSNSCTHDGAASDLSFAPDASADAHHVDALEFPPAAATQDGGVRSHRCPGVPAFKTALRPPHRPPIPPLRPTRHLTHQLGARTPRSTPRSGLENCFHSATRPMLPLAAMHQDVLDRYWSSQRDEVPLHRHGPSDTPRQPSHLHSHAEETASVADAPVHETPRAAVPTFFTTADMNPASAQSVAAAPAAVVFAVPPPQRNARGRAARHSAGGRPPRQTKGGAMLAKGGLLSRRRSRNGSGDDVPMLATPPILPDAPQPVQLPSPRLLLRARSIAAVQNAPVPAERDRERDCKRECALEPLPSKENDEWHMPAPPRRRSRGARITGLAVGSRQRPVAQPTQPKQTSQAQASRGKAGRTSGNNASNNNSGKSTFKPGAAGTSVALPMVPSAPTNPTPLQPRELPNLAGFGRPELNHSLPVCRVLNVMR